jgi:hypothetical protein
MRWFTEQAAVWAGVAGLLTWSHLDGALRWIALGIGVVGVVVAYLTTIRQFLAEWRSPGVEHHALERAGFITFALGMGGLYAYSIVCHQAHWRPVDPGWMVAVGA